jgi:hypothetical protein
MKKCYSAPTVITLGDVAQQTMGAKTEALAEQFPFFRPSIGSVGFYL